MIKKPVVAPITQQNQLYKTAYSKPIIQMASPKVSGRLRKPTVKPALDFNYCLNLVKTECDFTKTIPEDFISDQEKTMKGLIGLIENKVLGPYLLDKFVNSRFKGFNMATRTFRNMIEGYFEGNVDIEAIKAYQDTIPNSAGEHWYEEFNDFRYNFIDGLRNSEREGNFAKCIQILVEAETAKEVDVETNGYEKFLEHNIKLNRAYIIDLMQIVWPEQGGPLKLLFGN